MRIFNHIAHFLKASIYFGKSLSHVPDNSIVLFPYRANALSCGITGIVAFRNLKSPYEKVSLKSISSMSDKVEKYSYRYCIKKGVNLKDHYLGGKKFINDLWKAVKRLQRKNSFCDIFQNPSLHKELTAVSERLHRIIEDESQSFFSDIGHLSSSDAKAVSLGIEGLKDVAWSLKSEVLENIKKTKSLLSKNGKPLSPSSIHTFQRINTVLNSIDRLEVRGRDSAGISLLFLMKESFFKEFEMAVQDEGLGKEFQKRSNHEVLENRNISISNQGQGSVALAFTYKVASEIGRLGDNVNFIRRQIQKDRIFHILTSFPHEYHTVSTHTRWASIGAINEPNCHPQDNHHNRKKGIIHVCLNGDIDNYLESKAEIERDIGPIPSNITTDTKIIPLQIEKYLKQGHPVFEAIRLAVNDFEGSHAICVHTDLAPGRIFLAQKGSGQTFFVGLADEHYIPTSEVYGFVEETPFFLKMDGEKKVKGVNGMTQGQIFELNQNSSGGLEGIRAWYYDGTPVRLSKEDIKKTDITSRDIDRQGFPHYFLKEISESPVSVEKTLYNRWKIQVLDGQEKAVVSPIVTPIVTIDEKTVPPYLKQALKEKKIRRIFFVGQGTAGVAAQACSDILNYYFGNADFNISAQKASEFSGFMMKADDDEKSLSDTLVIAISQSGTTTDTNRTVDMVKARGAYTLAIVNRRDSDITFKVDGVMYTSSGRDIEMSVASTKAFYSQIVAGALLGLNFAHLIGKRSDEFIADEIQRLLDLPDHMRKILSMQEKIGQSARRLANTRTYWATVGSGPNKASADEIRIKLSELCYKTISSDFVEDKKHIDLSSEPLIIVCAAGSKEAVLTDVIKDTAIFKAHKAVPVVIADEKEDRFAPYADDVIQVPAVSEHLAPVLNTLVGHLWGYHAALAINDGSRFLFEFREEIRSDIDAYINQGLDVYEILLEKSFREKIARFYSEFIKRTRKQRFPSIMGLEGVSDLTLLLKYLSGRLPVSDFELDFGVKGTPSNMLETLFTCIGESINNMARPIDAIKHQAKTVTVGTSRISKKIEGIIFEKLASQNFKISQLTNSNVIVLKNLQKIISDIKGSILYKIGGLNLLGEPTNKTTIEVIKKEGSLKPIPSRVENKTCLKGIKRIIVRQGNVFIGKGRKDDRRFIIIPVISSSPSAPNTIEYLLLLNISFKADVPLSVITKALGGKYEHIKNIVQENSIQWDDKYLELLKIHELFGKSAEKIGEYIAYRRTGKDKRTIRDQNR